VGTSNFCTEDARCVYAISTSYEEEDREFVYDEFIVEDTCNNVWSELKKIISKTNTMDISNSVYNGYDFLRSYPGHSLGEISTSMHIKEIDIEVEVIIEVLCISGYYEGANLDYVVKFRDEFGQYSDNIENAIQELIDCLKYGDIEIPEGKAKEDIVNIIEEAETKLREKEEELRTTVENVFGMFTDAYKVSARFSNGEIIYEKCEDKETA